MTYSLTPSPVGCVCPWPSPHVPSCAEAEKKFLNLAQPFISWLEQSEESSSEGGSDDEEEDDEK